MPKKKTKKIKSKGKPKKDKLGTFKETAREKLIGQHKVIDMMLIYFQITKRLHLS